MTYTAIAVLAVVVAVAVDRRVARTRLTSTAAWWSAYAIIVAFQLLTNGWLTGRGIVRYDPATILGNGSIRFVGAGRLVFAPVEDLAFGFALVLTTCVAWVWLGDHVGGPGSRPSAGGVAERERNRASEPASQRVGRRDDEGIS